MPTPTGATNPVATTGNASSSNATRMATRANATPEYLFMSRAQLYAQGQTGNPKERGENDWENATADMACEGLHAKGAFITDFRKGEAPGLDQLSMALLRIAAHAQNKNRDATTAWACRAVAFLLEEMAKVVANDTGEKLGRMLTLLEERSHLTTTGDEGGKERETSAELIEAAAVLTRTVDEQREELETLVKRVEASVLESVERAGERADVPERIAQGQRLSYAAAAGENLRPRTREQIEMLGRTNERECQIRIENAPITDLSEKEIIAKAELAAKFAANEDQVPEDVRFLAARRVAKDVVLLRLSSKVAVDWVKANMGRFVVGLGGHAVYKERLYNVIGEFVPKTFAPQLQATLRDFERDNNLPPNSLASARYLKPVDRHSPTQVVAHVVLGFAEPHAANRFLRDGAFMEGKRVRGRKLLSEPVRCLKCQRIGTGHVAATCPDEHDTCARCAEQHRTADCQAYDDERACSNCRRQGEEQACRGHGAADRQCPTFRAKLQAALERNPDAKYTYFPVADDVSTWIEAGRDSADDALTPDWQTIIRARNRRPGAAQHIAVDLQRAMTGGQRVVLAKGTSLRQTAITEAFPVRAPASRSKSMVMGTSYAGMPRTPQTNGAHAP